MEEKKSWRKKEMKELCSRGELAGVVFGWHRGALTNTHYEKQIAIKTGFSSKSSSESDSARSPTSPLDFSFFSNLSNPFSLKSPKTSKVEHKTQWNGRKVGLGLVKLLLDETQQSEEVLKSPKRKNVIFGSQIKLGHDSLRSNSLPKNYVISLPSQTGEEEVVPLESMEFEESSSLSSLTRIPSFGLKKACLSANRSSSIPSLPVVVSKSLKKHHSLNIKPTSVPIPISSHEIELSEDYTCIISHGPCPKTTHIFGDCILPCHASSELTNFDQSKATIGFEMLPQEAKCPEEGLPSEEFLSCCYSCKKKLDNGDHTYMYRGEKAFCSCDCRSEEILGEDDSDRLDDNSSQNYSPKSSFHGDIF
ncbi:unnamed protein product [Linum tenue]|uniref:FLZ-type domain-containing protein n=1 Tax=Linum tenue TaxID=586396 RepID=A0AAV0KM72_9ROSI|nr:unnamed protein product [Linum tenue]